MRIKRRMPKKWLSYHEYNQNIDKLHINCGMNMHALTLTKRPCLRQTAVIQIILSKGMRFLSEEVRNKISRVAIQQKPVCPMENYSSVYHEGKAPFLYKLLYGRLHFVAVNLRCLAAY